MRNAHLWKPSKFTIVGGQLRANNDPAEVGHGSRFIIGILAQVYQDVIERHATGTIADLGCGKVPLYAAYRSRVNRTICIDWPTTHHRSTYLDCYCDLNERLPLSDGVCDTVLATDVLEHIGRPEVFWREMARILRPRGKVILGVPFIYWVHEEPFDFARYTEYGLRLFCDDAKLTLLELSAYGGSPEVILDMIGKHLAFSPFLSALYQRLISPLRRSSWVRRISDRTKGKYPLGYCLVAQKLP